MPRTVHFFGKRLNIVLGILAPLVIATTALGQNPSPLPNLDQGWSPTTRLNWYTATQGSRLIPAAWLRALEQPVPAGTPPRKMPRFMEPAHITSFGYLPRGGAAPGEPWPVGFAIDIGPDDALQRTALRWKLSQGEDEPWIGLNCAACHTSQITHKGATIRVDGGSAVADFKAFMTALNAALEQTRSDAPRWNRFVARVLKRADGQPIAKEQIDMLKSAFDKLVDWQLLEAKANTTPVQYGPSRVDAFGHIYNKVALLLTGGTAKGNAPDAPVSIPHIWRAPQYDKVQYNGIAPKATLAGFDFGALGRNAGEVIGVFGDVVVKPNPSIGNGFSSSVKAGNLSRFEDTLAKLRPPKWPSEVLGKPDPAKVAKGRDLFKRDCASCHLEISRTDLTSPITAEMSLINGKGQHSKLMKDGKPLPLPSPGTDPWMACNSFDYKAPSGVLSGYESTLLGEPKIPPEHDLATLLKVTVGGTLFGKKWELTKDVASKLIGADRDPRPELESVAATIEKSIAHFPANAQRPTEKQKRMQRCATSNSPIMGYTSRPLNGIWASPPYLHNGSVPTMYHLLLPPERRPATFHVGTREYDPKNMGYLTAENKAAGNSFEFRTIDKTSVPIDGNSNGGHDYGNAKLTDDDRFAIIEYLKTL